jgi:hypothetical protein
MLVVFAIFVAVCVVGLLGFAWVIVLRARQHPARQSGTQLTTVGLGATSILTAVAIIELVLGGGTQRPTAAAIVILASAGLLTLLLCVLLRGSGR